MKTLEIKTGWPLGIILISLRISGYSGFNQFEKIYIYFRLLQLPDTHNNQLCLVMMFVTTSEKLWKYCKFTVALLLEVNKKQFPV